ncbi:PIN domain-containing protein [Brevibacillus ruminantium]|uniref:PIN domain-containing protein n=1 Tax=Brevibacillus ruminantium TaxID=2950604 RepID=A0ABY4WKD9_9BACL|nr:PIN domain-containing protein [Brevibacillus ruminantium]USG66527.1 PIN domain-containing protein [Brevibacillus ruminantium]
MIWYNGVVIDTCVWIDIANNKEEKFLKTLENLSATKFLKLVIPEQVRIEWNKNKEERIVLEKNRLFESLLNTINNFKRKCSNEKNAELIALLNSVGDVINRDQPQIISEYVSLTERIDTLINHPNSIQLNDSVDVKNLAIDFALEKKAPFQRKCLWQTKNVGYGS